ncbi:M1 family peptidase [Halobacillus trueperi]|uniref:M1 family peptidase n=1 Tax=Halobacillus trueperi TaxID=156205 RepID=A0A3D8VIB9_9BACI|nr:M1 family metallopeptidase [Halobacillus trueperi]RDY69132.1 M1 family peptidase [Halobacillus trueperi]
MRYFIFLFFIFTLVTGLTGCESSDMEPYEEVKALEGFKPVGIPSGTDSSYDIKLKMDDEENFTVDAIIEIKNTSEDAWEEIPFYFIPNMFTAQNSPSLDKPSEVEVNMVALNGKEVPYSLKKDKLTIPLKQKINPNDSINVRFTYNFTLPEEGLRFTKQGEDFHLAQWYPMVPTYREGWNIESFRFKGETVHTPYSNFKIEYDVPANYTVATTSDEDVFPIKNKNQLKITQVKEVFIAILDDPYVAERELNNIKIRVYGMQDKSQLNEDVADIAVEAFSYFQDRIGPYPYKQFDIILNGMGMEYPGIVTAWTVYNSGGPVRPDAVKKIAVHEIAHQWFYGMINNDPFHDAWLDEGMAQLATSLFYSDYEGRDFTFKQSEKNYEELSLPVNLSLDQYPKEKQSSYIYGKSVVMLGGLFEDNGGKIKAENFLRNYYKLYKYKEVNSEEFIRFLKEYLDMKDEAVLNDWIQLEKGSKTDH